MDSTHPEIRALLDRRSEAIHAKDADRLMALYSDDVVYFDVVPPLQYTGAAVLRERFTGWFGRWRGPIGQELRDLRVTMSGDLAFAHMLIRASGTLQDAREVGYWVRTTNCCRRVDGSWVITQEHVSLPVDFMSGTAVMDLVP